MSESAGPITRDSNTFDMADWKERDLGAQGEPLSSSVSAATKSLSDQGPKSPAMADLDRLYKLDDEELEASADQRHTVRRYEP